MRVARSPVRKAARKASRPLGRRVKVETLIVHLIAAVPLIARVDLGLSVIVNRSVGCGMRDEG
jgi:hypothetical protein